MLMFTIPGRLPGLNEYISACRRNQYAGGKMKKTDQNLVAWYIRQQMRDRRITGPVRMVYRWYEKDRRRDLDNIASYGRKIIQDALVTCRILPDDGWNYVAGFEDSFFVDKKNPRIEVEMWPVQK